MSVVTEERISEAPWNGAASNYTDEQYEAACALDRKSCGGEWPDKPSKVRCSLPYKTPSGEISRAGTHAAAGHIGQVSDTCDEATSSAKAKLRAAYKALNDAPPASIGGSDKKKGEDLDELEELARQFGPEPGVPRHNHEGFRVVDTGGYEFRADSPDAGSIGTLTGHFCVFRKWTEINDFFEGRFMEQIAPGACKKTFTENRDGMRCLFQHGRDAQIGSKVLGPIRELEEDEVGGRYEVPMYDTSYNRDLLPALKDNQYGASFRFRVIREEVNTDPGRSAHNPDGIEERTITEMQVREFGPVTFPAYPDATAGVRSGTDRCLDVELDAFIGAHPGGYPMRLAQILLALRAESPNGGTESLTVETRSTETEPTPEADAAPPAGAPERTDRQLTTNRSTRLPGAARKPLRTSSEEEPWKL